MRLQFSVLKIKQSAPSNLFQNLYSYCHLAFVNPFVILQVKRIEKKTARYCILANFIVVQVTFQQFYGASILMLHKKTKKFIENSWKLHRILWMDNVGMFRASYTNSNVLKCTLINALEELCLLSLVDVKTYWMLEHPLARSIISPVSLLKIMELIHSFFHKIHFRPDRSAKNIQGSKWLSKWSC